MPIRAHPDGEVIAAISTAGPTGRLLGDHETHHVRLMLNAGRQLTNALAAGGVHNFPPTSRREVVAPTLGVMRSAVLRDGSDQLDIADVEHDEPIGREILVRSVAAGLCHSDYHYLDGTLYRPRPVILGHEGAGVVEAVGPDVRDIRVGDHVVTCLVMGCGECNRCAAGEPTRCLHPESTKRAAGTSPRLTLDGVSVGQMANVGSLADHILLDERAVTAISTDIPMELACILGCAVVTGLGAALNTADVQSGESVAVIGCGGVGLNIIQGARLAGAAADHRHRRQPRASWCGRANWVQPRRSTPPRPTRSKR